MYSFEELFTNHGFEYALAGLAFFIFIIVIFTLQEKKKY